MAPSTARASSLPASRTAFVHHIEHGTQEGSSRADSLGDDVDVLSDREAAILDGCDHGEGAWPLPLTMPSGRFGGRCIRSRTPRPDLFDRCGRP